MAGAVAGRIWGRGRHSGGVLAVLAWRERIAALADALYDARPAALPDLPR